MNDINITSNKKNTHLKSINKSNVVHPGYELNYLKKYCEVLRIDDADLSRETGLSKSYFNRIRREQIKIIPKTKILIVKTLNKLSSNLFMVEDIFPSPQYSAEIKGEDGVTNVKHQSEVSQSKKDEVTNG